MTSTHIVNCNNNKHLINTTTVPIDNAYILKLFNLEDKNISKLNITHESDGVHVYVELLKQSQVCPICGSTTSKINNYVNKKITHSIFNHSPCYINYHARRHICLACNKTFYENNPFSFDGMKISFGTVYNVLKDLKLANETFTSVSNRYHISPTQVANIFDHHINISRRPLSEYISIDEVYAFHSDDSKYVCVLLDFKTQQIIDILPSRKKYDLLNYFESIPREERSKVKMISTDMWETYRIVSKTMFPSAHIAADKFHLLQEYTKQFTRIRVDAMKKNHVNKDILKNLKSLSSKDRLQYIQQDNRYYLLKKFHWLFFSKNDKHFDPNTQKKFNRKLNRYLNYYDILELMLEDEALSEAYSFKCDLDDFYKYTVHEEAKQKLEELISKLNQSNLPELHQYANTLNTWKKPIIASFIIIDDKNRKINNGVIENINKSIKTIKRNANGYTNWKRFRNRIMYVINTDATFSLYPSYKENK